MTLGPDVLATLLKDLQFPEIIIHHLDDGGLQRERADGYAGTCVSARIQVILEVTDFSDPDDERAVASIPLDSVLSLEARNWSDQEANPATLWLRDSNGDLRRFPQKP